MSMYESRPKTPGQRIFVHVLSKIRPYLPALGSRKPRYDSLQASSRTPSGPRSSRHWSASYVHQSARPTFVSRDASAWCDSRVLLVALNVIVAPVAASTTYSSATVMFRSSGYALSTQEPPASRSRASTRFRVVFAAAE